MTGMGSDGLLGSQKIVEAGGQVIVQDEASSVVWGMPGAVYGPGHAEAAYPLSQLAGEITHRVRESRNRHHDQTESTAEWQNTHPIRTVARSGGPIAKVVLQEAHLQITAFNACRYGVGPPTLLGGERVRPLSLGFDAIFLRNEELR